jgi:hypothetical protein
MTNTSVQKFAQSFGLGAFVLLAIAACGGNGSSAPSNPVGAFRPTSIEASYSKENFTGPEGVIVTGEARKYVVTEGTPETIVMDIAATTQVGQDMKIVGDRKYVATDYCAGFSPDHLQSCTHLAVMFYRTQGEQNQTRTFLFKSINGKFEALCSRDVVYKDSAEAFTALKAECDPDVKPSPTPDETAAPAPTATP